MACRPAVWRWIPLPIPRKSFPDFTSFWFETVKGDATVFTVYALLDSPSITGAYKFTIHRRDTRVIMDVENHLYARKDIKQLGIAPMTSMFSCGNNERRMCDTIHPQIHDSDRLSMWLGNGEWVCRPLNNPQKLQFNAFQTRTRAALVCCSWTVISPLPGM